MTLLESGVLLDEETGSTRRKKSRTFLVLTYFPRKLESLIHALISGPSNPVKSEVSLPFKSVQLYPETLAQNMHPRLQRVLACGLICLCVLLNFVLAHKGYWGPLDSGYERLQCGINEDLWRGPLAACGLNGELCFPHFADLNSNSNPNSDPKFSNRYKFKCPANCYFEGRTFREWEVGNNTVYRYPYAVGGPDIYRGDSFICVAALHAGVISQSTGGCGVIEWIGPHTNFLSTQSSDGQYKSVEYDSIYPVNFRFVNEECHECRNKDIRVLHIAINAVFIYLIAYFSTNPAYLLFSLVSIGFWTVVLASNPTWTSETDGSEAEVFSLGLGRFLPCMMASMYIYTFATHPLMKNMHAHLSCAFFFGTAFLIGVIENYVFGLLPVDRIIMKDLKTQPGAWTVFVSTLVVLAVIVLSQAYLFWANGKFTKYFMFYVLQVSVLTLLAKLPYETLRIHHYILALVLLPGTCLQTTPSLLYQGLLLGLYVSGVARWDFAPVVQTDEQLSRGSELALQEDPYFTTTDVSDLGVVLHWRGSPDTVFNGYTLTINDVQRVIEPAYNSDGVFNLTEWVNTYDPHLSAPKYYIRVAAAALGKHNRQYSGKFSEPVVIEREVLQLL